MKQKQTHPIFPAPGIIRLDIDRVLVICEQKGEKKNTNIETKNPKKRKRKSTIANKCKERNSK